MGDFHICNRLVNIPLHRTLLIEFGIAVKKIPSSKELSIAYESTSQSNKRLASVHIFVEYIKCRMHEINNNKSNFMQRHCKDASLYIKPGYPCKARTENISFIAK